MHVLTYGDKEGLHPLVPQMRITLWKLKKIDFDSYYESYNYAKEKSAKKESKEPKVVEKVKDQVIEA